MGFENFIFLHFFSLKFEKCRSELVRLFSEPLLSRHTVSTHTLTAGTRLTTARLLLTRHTPLLPLRPFLSRLITEEATEAPTPGRGGKGLTVTPLELVSAAVKTLSSLFDHLTSAGSKVNLLSHSCGICTLTYHLTLHSPVDVKKFLQICYNSPKI